MTKTELKPMIEALKKKGINSYTFTCETKEICLLREPSINEVSEILPLINSFGGNQINFKGAADKLIEFCWIAGNDNIRKDENLRFEVGFAAISTINFKVADVKKN